MTAFPHDRVAISHKEVGLRFTPPISLSYKSSRMSAGLGAGWWKCCNCNREINKATLEEKCPDCDHNKCDQCTDPYDRPSDLADSSTTLSCWFGGMDSPAGLGPCGCIQLVDNTTASRALEPTEADRTLQTGVLVDSKLSSK